MRTSLLAVPLCLTLAVTAACEVVGEDQLALDEIEAAVPSTLVARAVVRKSGLENEEGGEADRDGRLTQAISAADFQEDYCPPGADYTYCWPSFFGSPYVQRKTWSMYGYVAAVDDTIDFRLRYKKHWYSSWSTLVSAQALPGQVHYVSTSYWGYRRHRRWEVLDNGDNLVRYSVRGSD